MLLPIVISMLLAILLFPILFLIAISPGKPEKINSENGISIIKKIDAGGINQYLIIRGIEKTKPVLLFLHGGPGTPEFAYVKKHNPDLEKKFVVVHWEQRGAGKSYDKAIPAESMTVKQFVSDAKEVSEYLISKFQKEKIYLMGHSWGSFLGIHIIKSHPELFHCYFGVGQVVDQIKSETISFEWVNKQAQQKNDKFGLKKLARLALPKKEDSSKIWLDYLLVQRTLVDKYGGGLVRNYRGKRDVVLPILMSKEYNLLDKLNYAKGAFFSIHNLWNEIINTNLSETVLSVDLPVYFLHGLYDYQTTHKVAKNFYIHLEAPKKKFFTFEHSAHSPIFDEPEKFNGVVSDIVNR